MLTSVCRRRLSTSAAAGRNWARNVLYSCARFHEPETVGELCELVSNAASVRALGSRHSFSLCADTEGDLISVAKLPTRVTIDEFSATVRCSAGTTYAALANELETHGWALHAMASLPHISVAGAISTATHGSGDTVGNLTTAVRAARYVAADGELRFVVAGEPLLQAVLLGSLGVLTEVTLRVERSYR